jgi:hypothetical protein
MRYRIVADGELADDEAARRTVGAMMRLFELGAALTVTAERDGVRVAEARLGVPEMAAKAPEMAAKAPETAAEALGVEETVTADYSSLRRRLEAAKLAGTRVAGGYRFWSNEAAAEVAVRIVDAWMRDERAAWMRGEGDG